MSLPKYTRAKEIEREFCENNLRNLQRAFNWITEGVDVAGKHPYSKHDGAYVDKETGDYGLIDVKHSQTYTINQLENQFTLSLDCINRLRQAKCSVLFFYSDVDEFVYALDVNKIIGYDRGTKYIVTNILDCVIEFRYWPTI